MTLHVVEVDDPRRGPRLPRGLLRRPALEGRLQRWAPVTALWGGHGYGKTVLVATWLADQPADQVVAVWVPSSATGDRERWWRAVGRRLHAAGGLGAGQVDRPVAEWVLPDDRRVVLVLDGIDHLAGASAVAADLVRLVEANRGLHVCLCSRRWHPALALIGARCDLEAIRPEDLLLDVEELGQLAHAMGKTPTREQLIRLHRVVGGWIGPLRMVLEAGDDSAAVGAEGVVADYVTAALSTGEGANLAEDLGRFALAERLEEAMVEDLCDDPDPRRLLDGLMATGLLERRQDGERVVLGFPPAARGALRAAYLARNPARAQSFHRRLAAWHLARGEGQHAFRHAAAGQDWETLREAWSRHWGLPQLDAPEWLREACASLPAPVRRGVPGLEAWWELVARARADHDPDRGATLRAWCDVSEAVLRREQGELGAGQLAWYATGHMLGLRARGRVAEADRLAAQVAPRVEAPAKRHASVSGWLHLHWGLTRTLMGDDDGAVRSYQRAWGTLSPEPPGWQASMAAGNLALVHAARGQAAEAEWWLERHRLLGAGDPRHRVAGFGGHVAAGLLALDRLDAAAAFAELDHLVDAHGPSELWAFAASLRAQHALHHGDPAAALEDLDGAIEAHGPEVARAVASAAVLARARADLLVAGGDLRGARALLGLPPGGDPAMQVVAARVHLVAGEHAAARGIADRLLWRPGTPARHRQELLLVAAAAALHDGDPDVAGRMFGQALDLHRETRLLRAFATLPSAVREELSEVSGRHLGAEDLAGLAGQRTVLADRLVPVELTNREQAVLAVLATTASRQAIADQLFVSRNTVSTQITSLYRKLKATNRRQALAAARQRGLLI